MKHMLLVGMIGVVSAAFGYSGLETSLKELAVRFTDTDGHENCFVLGSPSDYNADWWNHTKECVFDGYTWYEHQNDRGETVYDNQGYFEQGDETTEGWAGYQLSKPMVVTRIRFWAGKDAGWADRVMRSQGVRLQAANTADFSDAVTLYTITEDKATLESGPIEINVDPAFQTKTSTYVRMIAPAGSWCGNVAEVEFYGVESIEKVLTGTVFASDAVEGHASDAAFDHDKTTYYQTSIEEYGFIGLDLGTSQMVSGFRFVPEQGQAWRMQGGKVQVSDTADFDNATTLYEFPWESPADGVVTTIKFEMPAAGRYVRFLASNRQCSVAEIEFLGVVSAPTAAPSDFAIAGVDAVEGRATLTWTPTAEPQRAGTTRILRATAPGGPYAVVGTSAGTSWNDPEAKAGVAYYYQAQFVDTDAEGNVFAGPVSARLTHKGIMQLDRGADGALRAGRTPVWYHHPYGGDETHTAAALFDGSLETFSDLVNENDKDEGELNAAAGLDLGEDCVITAATIYPRAENVGRLNNQVVWGSTEVGTGAWRTERTQLSGRLLVPEEGAEYKWYDFTITTTQACRTVFFMNDWGWGYANAAEMKVYGYRVADVEAVLLAPLEATCVWGQADVVLGWTACQNAASYRIERRAKARDDEGASWGEWETVATGLTEFSYRDTATRSRKDYSYRIVSVKGEEEAYSDPYEPTGVRGKRGMLLFFK